LPFFVNGLLFSANIHFFKVPKIYRLCPPLSRVFTAKESTYFFSLGDEDMRGREKQMVKPDPGNKAIGRPTRKRCKNIVIFVFAGFLPSKKGNRFSTFGKNFSFLSSQGDFKKPMFVYPQRYGMSRHNLCSLLRILFFLPKL
jgi:hypothetical protein